jgi:glycosyltransferase involved in cell wall biosynthesis
VPKISVLMPHFGCEAYLGEAVGSVLGQDHSDLELHVADDASPDDRWLEVLAPYRGDPRLIVWRASRNVGPYRIKNALLERCAGAHVAFHDADDRSAARRLSRQLEYLEGARLDVVGSWVRYIREGGEFVRFGPMVQHVNLWRWIGLRTVVKHATCLVRRELFAQVRGFDGTARVSADDDFIFRAAHVGKIRNLRAFLYDVRLTSTSLTRAPATGLRSEMRREYDAGVRRREAERGRLRDRAALLRSLVPPGNDVEFVLERVD